MSYLEIYRKAFSESDALNIQWSRKSEADRILIAKLQAQLAEANEVIDFYGDEDNYDWVDFQKQKEMILDDSGKKAREYQEKYKEV